MKWSTCFRVSIVALASLGVILPQMAYATGPVAGSPAAATSSGELVARDVQLDQGGVLRGQVLDAQASPVADARVTVAHQNGLVRQTTTDQQGRFAVEGLKVGVCQVATAEQVAVYRLWTPEIAPPAAKPGVLLVQDGTLVRAALGPGRPSVLGFLSSPWALGAIVATAIAIPLAMNDDAS